MRKRVNFVLSVENEELLNKYNSYAPEGFVLNLSELLNTILTVELSNKLHALEHVDG